MVELCLIKHFMKSVDEEILEHEGGYRWLPDFVYGGIDGAITTFAVVAGVAGANLSIAVILILGFANLFADGFSMAVGKYLSDKTDRELYEKLRNTEFRHLREKPEVERKEVFEIFSGYGLKGKTLENAVDSVVSDPENWVEIMMKHEFGMNNTLGENHFKGAIVTLISFIVIGFIPLFAYSFRGVLGISEKATFVFTCISTLLALFIVGAVKSKFSLRAWYFSGIQTMLIGGLAASIAYFVGFFLKSLA